MRLVDLEPRFLVIEDEHVKRQVDSPLDADGVMFACPLCYAQNGHRLEGVHSIICWRPRVPATELPGPGRWELEGSGFDDLTLRAGSSSVELHSGCKAHFFVTGGAITMCGSGFQR